MVVSELVETLVGAGDFLEADFTIATRSVIGIKIDLTRLNLSKLGLPQSEIECTDEPGLFPNICDQFSYLKCVFENLVIRVGCFDP